MTARIIDMHYHALPNGAEGPPDHPDNVAYMEQALEQLSAFNVVYAATSGPPNFLDYWQALEPDRLLTSPTFPCVDGLTPTYNRQPCFADGGDLPEPGWLETTVPRRPLRHHGRAHESVCGNPL